MSKPGKTETEIETETDEGGGFLSRWSRRKADAREVPAQPSVALEDPVDEEAFDLASLPSIEDLTAESDFSVFLKKGVPSGLRAAALRKLWLVEPSVVNYQPLVEYNWDFTAPGYGELLPTDDVVKFVKTVFEGTRPAVSEPEVPAVEATSAERQALPPPPQEEPVLASDDVPVAALDPQPQSETPPPRRRHGGALPD